MEQLCNPIVTFGLSHWRQQARSLLQKKNISGIPPLSLHLLKGLETKVAQHLLISSESDLHDRHAMGEVSLAKPNYPHVVPVSMILLP